MLGNLQPFLSSEDFHILKKVLKESAQFLKNNFLTKVLISECQTVWIQIKPKFCWSRSGSKLFVKVTLYEKEIKARFFYKLIKKEKISDLWSRGRKKNKL